MGRGGRILIVSASTVGVIATLYFGRSLIAPFAVALLVSLLLAPAVHRLHKWGVPRTAACVGVVLTAFLLLVAGGWILTSQAVGLSKNLPKYRETINTKLKKLGGSLGPLLGKGTEAAEEVQRQLSGLFRRPGPIAEPDAVKVTVVESSPRLIMGVAGTVVNSIGEGAVVLLLVCFFLIYHSDLRERVIRLVGDREVGLTTQAMDEAATGISRYLLIHSLLNTIHGTVLGLGLLAFGVPYALLWGLLGGVLRFIPYLGPVVSSIFPTMLAFAVFEGTTRPVLVACFIAGIELLSNNVLEPWFYGSRTGLSPLAIVVSAVLWATIWGPIGLLLAVPLSVCLLVMGRHVPGLEFLAVLLGTEPPLEPKVRLYQRLLAGDVDEALEAVTEWRSAHAGEDPWDGLILPTVRVAAVHRQRESVDPERMKIFLVSLEELVEQVEDAPAAAPVPGARVVCLPVEEGADEAACGLFARMLRSKGMEVDVVSATSTSGEKIERVERAEPAVVVLSATAPLTFSRARYLHKLLRRRRPDLPVVVGLWMLGAELVRLRERYRPDEHTYLAGSFADAASRVREECEGRTLARAAASQG